MSTKKPVNQYQQKPKRKRDPNLPPPPNLFSQAKELRLTKEEMERIDHIIRSQHTEIETLRRRCGRLESEVNVLQHVVRRIAKNIP